MLDGIAEAKDHFRIPIHRFTHEVYPQLGISPSGRRWASPDLSRSCSNSEETPMLREEPRSRVLCCPEQKWTATFCRSVFSTCMSPAKRITLMRHVYSCFARGEDRDRVRHCAFVGGLCVGCLTRQLSVPRIHVRRGLDQN